MSGARIGLEPVMLEYKSEPATPEQKSDPKLDSDPEPELEVHIEEEPESMSESTSEIVFSSNFNPLD